MTAVLNTTGVLFGNSTQQNTAAYNGFRNLIDNGDFRVDNKYDGTLVTYSGSTGYTIYQSHDRWFAGAGNAATTHTVTVQRTTTQFSDTELTSNNGLSLVCTAYNSGAMYVGQRIEGADCVRFAGKTMTFSYWINGTIAGAHTWAVYTPTTKDTWFNGISFSSGKTLYASGSLTAISTTPGLRSFQFTMPALATAALGLEIQILLTPTAVSQGFAISNVQLEVGSIRTPFEPKPYSYELERCARFLPSYWGYYYTNAGLATGVQSLIALGVATGGTTAEYMIPLKVPTRVPVTGFSAALSYPFIAFNAGGTSAAITGSVLTGSSEKVITLSQTSLIAGSFTAGSVLRILMNSSTTQRMWFTGAEL
jgi:hypothetical protein